ncbi:MAG: energy transducer TonB [Gammaproteobacteria bacterium]|nr:energy transducer TonB [Gammaproteobacteria bacterium]
MKKIQRAACLAAILVTSTGIGHLAFAQDGAVAPQPVAQPQPDELRNILGTPVEGWVVVRYTVLADGTTADISIVEAMPPMIDTRAVAESVARWTFTPGMRDGEAVDWPNNESVVIVRLPSAPDEASEEFVTAYQEIGALIESQSYDEALQQGQRLLRETSVMLEETALALAQASVAYFGSEQLHEAHRVITAATDPRVDVLVGEDLLIGLQLRFQIETHLGRVNEALVTHRRIAELIGPDQEDPYAAAASQLDENWRTAEIIQTLGHIGDEPWNISADRRTFTISMVDGNIDSIDVECDARRISLDFQQDVEWQLPESWGDCELFVNGDSGTDFSFFHLLPPSE